MTGRWQTSDAYLDLLDWNDPVLAELRAMRAEAVKARQERDAAYRRALGVTSGPLPKVVGNATDMGGSFNRSRFR